MCEGTCPDRPLSWAENDRPISPISKGGSKKTEFTGVMHRPPPNDRERTLAWPLTRLGDLTAPAREALLLGFHTLSTPMCSWSSLHEGLGFSLHGIMVPASSFQEGMAFRLKRPALKSPIQEGLGCKLYWPEPNDSAADAGTVVIEAHRLIGEDVDERP